MALRCVLFKNGVYEAESGKLVVIPDSMEELLEVAKTKLNITRADRVFNNAGIVVDDVALIRDADYLYVAGEGEPFIREGGGAAGPSSSGAGNGGGASAGSGGGSRASRGGGGGGGGKKNGGKVPTYRIAVVGGGSVGKSCITLRFTKDAYVAVYDPTIEDVFQRICTIDERVCVIDILDTAGQDDFYVLRQGWIEDRDGFLLVYAINKRISFTVLEEYATLIRQVKEDVYDETPLVVVGNKKDLEGDRQVQADLGRQFAESLVHATFHEVSAKTGEGIEEVFFDIARQFRAHEPEPSDDTDGGKKGMCVLL